jgi:thiol:disulfide interchange protein DsbC
MVGGLVNSAPCAEPLSVQAAEEALKALSSDVKVVAVEASPVAGLWEVTAVTRGTIGIIYLDSSGKYVFSGTVLDISTKTNVTRDKIVEANKKYEDLLKVDASLIPLDDAIVLGEKDAKYRVIVFDDPD